MSYRKIRAKKTGPGGITCPCCTPGGRAFHKRDGNRAVRRAGKAETFLQALEQGQRFDAGEIDLATPEELRAAGVRVG